MIMGLAYMTSPPLLWRDIVLIVFQLFALVYAMPTNRQLDHSFPAVLDIFVKGLNLPAPLDIQWPKCFQLQGGGFAPWPPDQGLCPQTPVIRSCSALAMVPPNHSPFPPPLILAPRAPHLFWQVYAYVHRLSSPHELIIFSRPSNPRSDFLLVGRGRAYTSS